MTSVQLQSVPSQILPFQQGEGATRTNQQCVRPLSHILTLCFID